MQVSKKEGKVLERAIENWLETGVISEEESNKFKGSYEVIPFDWRRVAKYSFWVAIACIFISISSLLAHEWFQMLFTALFAAFFYSADAIKSGFFVVLSTALFYFAVKKKKKSPGKIYSNEAVFFLGIVTTAAAIAFFGMAVSSGSGHFSLLLLLASIVYGVLGLWFPSKLVWVFSLLSLGSWFGAETGYVSGWGAYYFGLNYPSRFVLFSLVLLLLGSYVFNKWEVKNEFLKPTKAIGLLYLFLSLWILSIFGNYGDIDAWFESRQVELFHWSILFALAAIGAIYHGVKYDDAMTRGFGIAFILINLYTRFFEHFWNSGHKAIFFGLMALSFWYLGTRAEKIWQLSLVKKLTDKNSEPE